MPLPPRIAQHLPQIISSVLAIIALLVGLATVSESSSFGSSFGSSRNGEDSAKNTTVPVKTTSTSPTSKASPTSLISKPTQDEPPASFTAPLLTPQTNEANPEPKTSEISNKELQEVIDNLDLKKSSKIEFDESQQRITISDHGSIKVANRRVSLKNQNAPLSITFDLSGKKRENTQLSELSAFGSVLAPMGVHAAPSDASSGVEISFTLPHAPSGSMNTGIIHFDEVLDYWTPEQTLTSTDGKTFTTTVNQLSAFSFGAFVDPSHAEYYKLDDAEVRQKNLETWNSADSIIDNPSAVVTTDILKFLKDEKAIHFDGLNRFPHNDRANKYFGSELAIQDDARECAEAFVSGPDWIEPPSNQNFNLEIPHPPYWLCIDSSGHPEKLSLQYKLADLVPLQLAISGGRDVENDGEKRGFSEDYFDSSDPEYQAFLQTLIKQAAANSVVFPTTEKSNHLDKVPLVAGVKTQSL